MLNSLDSLSSTESYDIGCTPSSFQFTQSTRRQFCLDGFGVVNLALIDIVRWRTGAGVPPVQRPSALSRLIRSRPDPRSFFRGASSIARTPGLRASRQKGPADERSVGRCFKLII